MKLSDTSFAAWIEPLEVVRTDGNVVYLKTELSALEEYVEKTFFSCLSRATKEICYRDCEFKFDTLSETQTYYLK